MDGCEPNCFTPRQRPRLRASRSKRARVETSTTAGDHLNTAFPNHVWAADFAFCQPADDRVSTVLTITGKFASAVLAIDIERSIAGVDPVHKVDPLVVVRGHLRFIRMDNGSEMPCHAIADWCRFSATGSVFIEPGSPWQNAFLESFNGKLRDELLAIELFHSLLEAKVMAEDYRQHYNAYRPHSSLGYRTPNEFTLDWNNNYSGLAKTLVHQPGAGRGRSQCPSANLIKVRSILQWGPLASHDPCG